MSSEMKKVSEATSINSNATRYNEKLGDSTGQSWPLGIFWDTKTCSVRVDAQADSIAINIMKAPGISAKKFYIYGKSGLSFESVKAKFQNIDVKFMNVQHGRKDSGDEDILADMLGFAYDNHPHAVIMLISGDVGCAQTLHILNRLKHTIHLIVPTGMDMSLALCNPCKFVWDWPSLANGNGFVSSRTSISHHPDIRGLQQPSELDKLFVKPLEHLETENLSEVTSTDSNERSVGIFWDIENCQVPCSAQCANIEINILKALERFPEINGVVNTFSAYGNIQMFPDSVNKDCQDTAVNFIHVAGGRKNSADKAIINGMFTFAFDYRPPASIMLISGDADFAHALHMLHERNFQIILAVPRGKNVSRNLYSAGDFVWDWPCLARGDGPLSPRKLDKSGKVSRSLREIWQRVKKPVQHNDIQTPKIQLMEPPAVSLGDYLNEQGSYTELELDHSWEEAETSRLKEENFCER